MERQRFTLREESHHENRKHKEKHHTYDADHTAPLTKLRNRRDSVTLRVNHENVRLRQEIERKDKLLKLNLKNLDVILLLKSLLF